MENNKQHIFYSSYIDVHQHKRTITLLN